MYKISIKKTIKKKRKIREKISDFILLSLVFFISVLNMKDKTKKRTKYTKQIVLNFVVNLSLFSQILLTV